MTSCFLFKRPLTLLAVKKARGASSNPTSCWPLVPCEMAVLCPAFSHLQEVVHRRWGGNGSFICFLKKRGRSPRNAPTFSLEGPETRRGSARLPRRVRLCCSGRFCEAAGGEHSKVSTRATSWRRPHWPSGKLCAQTFLCVCE